MPSTSSASISSRMVRAPRSAQMAVDPAPATTSTVTSGPSWVTAPSAAPAPETSAAPNSASRMLSVKMISTVSGIETATVGRNATRMRNQLCRMNSRHSNGRNSALPVSTHIRKKPPTSSQRSAQLVAHVTGEPARRRRHARTPGGHRRAAAPRSAVLHAPSLPRPEVCDVPSPYCASSKRDHRNVPDGGLGVHCIGTINPTPAVPRYFAHASITCLLVRNPLTAEAFPA